VIYADGTTGFDQQVQQLVDAAPKAVVMFGYAESSAIIAELIERGIGPAR
jgi:hypothetical protein